MCCYRFNTETLMANLFAKLPGHPARCPMDGIYRYFRYLSEKSPTYLTTDLSEQAVLDCAARYPELYRVTRGGAGTITVVSNMYRPNLEYFNQCYQAGLRWYLEYITDSFLAAQEQETDEGRSGDAAIRQQG